MLVERFSNAGISSTASSAFSSDEPASLNLERFTGFSKHHGQTTNVRLFWEAGTLNE